MESEIWYARKWLSQIMMKNKKGIWEKVMLILVTETGINAGKSENPT